MPFFHIKGTVCVYNSGFDNGDGAGFKYVASPLKLIPLTGFRIQPEDVPVMEMGVEVLLAFA